MYRSTALATVPFARVRDGVNQLGMGERRRDWHRDDVEGASSGPRHLAGASWPRPLRVPVTLKEFTAVLAVIPGTSPRPYEFGGGEGSRARILEPWPR